VESQGHTYLPSAPHPGRAGGRRDCLASLDASLTVLAADAAFLRQFGGTPSEICGRSIYDLISRSASPALDGHLTKLAAGRSPEFTEWVVGVRGPHGFFSAELTGVAVHSEVTSVVCAVVLRPGEEPPRRGERSHRRPSGAGLSPLGAQILEGMACGDSTEQLAARLYLSRQGVEYHIGQMFRKLRVPNRTALVARAHSKGMFAPGVWPPRILPECVWEPRRRTPAGAVRSSLSS
jgi:DNA-binding CsgD family transcriptional regulator